MIESLDRRARHEERFKSSVLHGDHALSGNSFVVKGIPAIQVSALPLSQSRIEHDRQKFRENAGAEAFSEGLAFAFIFLAMPLNPVPENLVEEDAGGSSGEDGRAEEGLHNRGLQEASQVATHTADRSQQHIVGGKRRWIGGVEGGGGTEVHTIGGAPFGGNRQAHEIPAMLNPAALRV